MRPMSKPEIHSVKCGSHFDIVVPFRFDFHDRNACLEVSVHERMSNWRGTSPSWQQTSVNIENTSEIPNIYQQKDVLEGNCLPYLGKRSITRFGISFPNEETTPTSN